MQKRTKALIGAAIAVVVVVVGVLVGTRLYAGWVNDNADAAPTLGGGSDDATSQEESPDEAGAQDVALDGDWTIAEGSFAGYRVDEVLNGADITVTGRTEDVTGAVTLADGSLETGTIEVDLTTVATDEASRDEYFRGEALQTDQFPTGTFELTEPVDVVADGSDVELVGDLTIHGVTQPVTVTAQVGASGSGLQVVGSAPITFSDFDVDAPDLGFVVVEDAGAIEFSLELAAG